MTVVQQLQVNYDVIATCQSNLQVVTMLRKISELPWLPMLLLLDARRGYTHVLHIMTVSVAQQVRIVVPT